jgi:hypothetical protein
LSTLADGDRSVETVLNFVGISHNFLSWHRIMFFIHNILNKYTL